jgi:hypothetical protein
MRILLCLITVWCVLPAAERPSTQQGLEDAALALIKMQRQDGGWDLRPDHLVIPTIIDPPPAGGQSARPLPAPEDRFRNDAVSYAFIAEALWLVADRVPTAAAAADKAQRLTARALLARAENPVHLMEAVAFLRAEAARTKPCDDAVVLTAQRESRRVFDAAVHQGSVGDLILGLPVTNSTMIDLATTFWAEPLISATRHIWVPTLQGDDVAHVYQLQSLLPETRLDRVQALLPDSTSMDGTALAVAFMLKPSDAALQQLHRLYGEAELSALGLDQALACMQVFAKRKTDGPEAWWRGTAERWTTALLAQAARGRTTNESALWEDSFSSVAIGDVYVIHWLLACVRIQANDAQWGQRQAEAAWGKTHVEEQLARLAALQQPDGSWQSSENGDAVSALACLAFLSAGYDHITPNKHRAVVRSAFNLLQTKKNDADSLADRALQSMALSEAYAMTVDHRLLPVCRQRIADMLAARLPTGGWPTHPGADLDWRTTALSILALQSAAAGGLEVPLQDLTSWWSQAVGEAAQDPPTTLAWKTTAGLFLGPAAQPRSATLGVELSHRLADWTPEAMEQWGTTLALFSLHSDAWAPWRSRCMLLPLPSDRPVAIALRLLADEVINRDLQARNLQ